MDIITTQYYEQAVSTCKSGKRKSEQYAERPLSASQKSTEYFNASNKHRDFLSIGEPIKVGHHSERRRRKMIDDTWCCNMGKCCEYSGKAEIKTIIIRNICEYKK